MSRRELSWTILAVLLAGALVGLELRHGAGRGAGGGAPRLSLVTRDQHPWLLWEGPEASGVVFEMEGGGRREVIGVATDHARRHAVRLQGWLGTGPVTVRARPDLGPAPPALTLDGGRVLGYLDGLAEAVLVGDRGEAWQGLGRFAGLYFASPRAGWKSKRALQRLLVVQGPEAGPGGAGWMWGEAFRPARVSGLPGAREVRAPAPEDPHLIAGQALHVDLPPVPRGARVELTLRLTVSPTPAPPYRVEAEFETGWTARLEPGPTGGAAFQRLDPRALLRAGTGVALRLRGGEGAVLAEVEEVAVRYLPDPRDPPSPTTPDPER